MNVFILVYSVTHKHGAAVNQQVLSQTSNNAYLHYAEPPTQKSSGPLTWLLLAIILFEDTKTAMLE